jgi:hypothetical protein
MIQQDFRANIFVEETKPFEFKEYFPGNKYVTSSEHAVLIQTYN